MLLPKPQKARSDKTESAVEKAFTRYTRNLGLPVRPVTC